VVAGRGVPRISLPLEGRVAAAGWGVEQVALRNLNAPLDPEPFERSSHGLLGSNRSTGAICRLRRRLEAPQGGGRRRSRTSDFAGVTRWLGMGRCATHRRLYGVHPNRDVIPAHAGIQFHPAGSEPAAPPPHPSPQGGGCWSVPVATAQSSPPTHPDTLPLVGRDGEGVPQTRCQ